MSFYSMPFHNNVHEGKKINFWLGPLFLWSFHILCMSVSRYPNFLPRPKDVHIKWIGMSKLSQFEWVWICVSAPCDRRVPCPVQGWFSLCALSRWSEWVGKECSYLLLLIFLKCMYNSLLLVFNIESVLGLNLEVGFGFHDQKYDVGT